MSEVPGSDMALAHAGVAGLALELGVGAAAVATVVVLVVLQRRR